MSLQSVVGNTKVGAQNAISNILSTATSSIQNIIGNAKTGLSNIWSGGFAGMSESGMADLKTALKNYCDAIEAQINTFDEEGNISNAYKGNINNAAREYIRSIKELLNAYVTQMKANISEADEAYQNYMTGSESLSQSVSSDAESIRSEASKIRLD